MLRNTSILTYTKRVGIGRPPGRTFYRALPNFKAMWHLSHHEEGFSWSAASLYLLGDCFSSEVTAYHLDESTGAFGALIQAYRVRLAVKDNPGKLRHLFFPKIFCIFHNFQCAIFPFLETVSGLRAVRCLEWSPVGSCFASAWSDRNIVALWSVFGAQLWWSIDSRHNRCSTFLFYTCFSLRNFS